MARSWCKVSAHLDSHPRIRRAGNLGRQVFEFALRRNAELDRGGAIGGDHLDPEYLANVLMLTPEQAKEGVSRCVRTGLLAQDGPDFVISGWDDEWAKGPLTEAERKRAQRAKSRNETVHDERQDNVRTLSGRDRDCPDSHALEEKRREEKRLEEPPIPPKGGSDSFRLQEFKATVDAAVAPARDAQREADAIVRARKPRPAKPDATPAELDSVRVILDRLGKVAGVAYRGCDSHTRLVVNQLRGGITELELRAVVAYCADEWEGKPEMRKYLRPETLFGPQTIHKYLDAARSRYAREIAAVDDKPKLEVVR